MSEPPVAQLEQDRGFSPVWLVPLGALALALALAWQHWGRPSTSLRIQLDDGHGLRAGDTLRHHGIVAGRVTAVRHAEDLGGVRVEVELEPDAEGLARVGSRFWVVRPRFGFSGISGLDTLVGDRYLAVIPGEGAEQVSFVGLPEPPIPEALQPGLDLTLEAPDRGSIGPGSPVSYRGMAVGAVLAVSLASDGRSVEVAVRVRQEYSNLVRPDSRFWETSGLGLEVGLTGANLHLASLESLVRGGISFATPPGEDQRVSTGHRFALHEQPETDWLGWRPSLAVGHSLLPPGAPVPAPQRARQSWTEGRLWSGDAQRNGWVLALPGALLGPADLLQPAAAAHKDSAQLEVGGSSLPLLERCEEPCPGLALRPQVSLPGVAAWPRSQQRAPEGPEDCLLVTEPGSSPLSLAPGALQAGDDGWHIDPALPVDESWHGAPVLARSDGRLIGLVLVDDDVARVVPLPRPLP